jgi:hypothetical protein
MPRLLRVAVACDGYLTVRGGSFCTDHCRDLWWSTPEASFTPDGAAPPPTDAALFLAVVHYDGLGAHQTDDGLEEYAVEVGGRRVYQVAGHCVEEQTFQDAGSLDSWWSTPEGPVADEVSP